jgi:hypothetical protein
MGGGPIRQPVQPVRSTQGLQPNQTNQTNQANPTDPADPTDAWNGTGSRIFLRRLAHDEPSGSTQAAAKPDRGCSLAASDVRTEVMVRRNGGVTSTTA